VFQQTWVPDRSPLADYLTSLEEGFCPYLQSSRENETLFFSEYVIREANIEGTQARLFLLGLVHTEWLRYKRKAAKSPDALLICENLILDVPRSIVGPALFGWPHFILKALYTECGLLFGKFWVGEIAETDDGRHVPIPPLHIFSIRSAVKKRDHRFFERVMTGMRPEFDKAVDLGISPLTRAEWIPAETAARVIGLVESNPSQKAVAALVDELITTNVYLSARSWARNRLKEIKHMESAIKNATVLGQILPKLVERVGTPLTAIQQITDRRGAAVWRADTAESGSYAIKYATGGDAGPHDPSTLVRREAAVLKEIGAPAGDILVDAGELDDAPFLVTRWFDAATSSSELAKQLRQGGSAPDLERLALLAERVVEKVAHVHAAGWVHGDIQPPHFMVDALTSVQLLDWALARREDRSDGRKHAGCFVHYAAPEIATSMLRGDAETGYNQASEVWAVCAALIFLLTGLVAVDYGSEPDENGPARLRYRLGRIASGEHVRTAGGPWDGSPLDRGIRAGLQQVPGNRPTASELLRIIRAE
jgi:serine/threonine protein kinase